MSRTGKNRKGPGPLAVAGTAPDEKGGDAGAYPLYLIPQVLSREIHARGGTITAITVRRAGRHNYRITITDAAAASPTGAAAGTSTTTATPGGSA